MIYLNLKCREHGFSYVSMPRDPEDLENRSSFVAKCPLKECFEGLLAKAPMEVMGNGAVET